MTQSWQFSAIDTLFFRESRPMESIGGSELGSVFPPPPRTLIGAIRTALGEAEQVDWSKFEEQSDHFLRNLIGYADDLGSLSFDGVWVHYKGERLYPMPSNLIAQMSQDRKKQIQEIDFLGIGQTDRKSVV